VLGLLLVDVLPDVCASIIRLNVKTSATINKAFFMLFSNFVLFDGAFGEAIERSSAPSVPVRTFISNRVGCSGIARGGLPFNPASVARLRATNAIF
jgi:hypothetical protein